MLRPRRSVLRTAALTLVLVAASATAVLGGSPASATVPTANGPVFPPPGGGTFVRSGRASDPGGVSYKFSAFDPSAFSQLVWGLDGTPPSLAMEAGGPTAADQLTYNAAQSNLANGLLVFTGQTSVQGIFYTGPVPTKLVVTVTDISNVSSSFIPQTSLPDAAHLDATLPSSVGNIGAVALVPPDGSGNLYLQANLQFLASGQAANSYFNSIQHTSGSVQSSVGAGFYWTSAAHATASATGSTDAGSEPVGGTSSTLIHGVLNSTGPGDLHMDTVTPISVAGADPNDFSVQNSTCTAGAVIPSGQFCTFDVAFSPQDVGARSGSILLHTNTLDTPQVLDVTGTGTPPLTVVGSGYDKPIKGVAYSQHLTTTGGGPGPDHWSLGAGSLPPGLQLDSSGLVHGTPTQLGTSTFTANVSDSSSPPLTTQGQVTLTVVPIGITTKSLADGPIDVAYKGTVVAAGGTKAYKFTKTAGALPPGVVLSTAGALTGTPTTAGTSTFTVTVTDASKPVNTASATLSITITPMVVKTTAFTDPVQKAFAGKLLTSGGKATFVWSLVSGTLPPGIKLASTGAFSGTPTTPGNSTIVVSVHDAAKPVNTASASVTIVITPLTITTTAFSDPVDKAFAGKLVASGGKPTLVWSFVSGALPAGIKLASTGAFSGTPTTPGTSTFTVKVTDTAKPANVATALVTIVVTPITITTTSLPNGTLKKAYSAALKETGGKSPFVYSVIGSLPPGLKMSTAGAFSGTPTVAGQFTFTVKLTDSTQPTKMTTTSTFTIVVS